MQFNTRNAIITPDALQSQLLIIRINTLPEDIKRMIMYFAYQGQKEAYKEKQYKLAPLCMEIFGKRLTYSGGVKHFSFTKFFFNRCIFNDNRAYDENTHTIINEANTIHSILVMKRHRNKNHIHLTRKKVEELLKQEDIEICRIKGIKSHFVLHSYELRDGEEELLDEEELTPKLINIYKEMDYYIRKYISMTNYKFSQETQRDFEGLEKLEQIYTSYGHNYNICRNGNPHKDEGCYRWSIYDTQKIYKLLLSPWELEADKVNYIRNIVEENDESEEGDECYVFPDPLPASTITYNDICNLYPNIQPQQQPPQIPYNDITNLYPNV